MSDEARNIDGRGESDEPEEPPSPPPLFGYRRFVPAWLQRVNKAQVFEAFLCLFAFSHSFPPNGLLNANTAETLKERYGFTSTQLGLFGAAYDVLAAIIIVPLCHYASKGHKPHYLAAAILVITAGSVMMSVPHFAIGAPALLRGEVPEVPPNATVALESTGTSATHYFCIFLTGQCIASYGGIALNTLGIVFIEENVLPRQLPLYMGTFMGCSALGSVLGFLVAGWFQSDAGHGVEDQRWISAWWVGYVGSTVVGLVMLVIFLGYPKELPSGRKMHSDRMAVIKKRPRLPPLEGFESSSFSSLPHHTMVLLKNKAYVCLTLGGAFNVAAQSGVHHFLADFLEIRFEQGAARSLTLSNLVHLPAAAVGCIIGGVAPAVFNCTYQTLVSANFALSAVCFLLAPMFWMHCERPFNATDGNGTLLAWRVQTYDVGGNGGANGGVFCNGTDAAASGDCCDRGGCASGGSEQSIECPATYGFLFLIFCAVFATFAKHVWSTVLTLHVVPDGYQFYALGLQAIVEHLVGSGPAAILFGYLFDDVRARDEAMTDELGTVDEMRAAYADYTRRRQELSRNVFLTYAALFLLMAIVSKAYKLPIAASEDQDAALSQTLQEASEQTELVSTASKAAETSERQRR